MGRYVCPTAAPDPLISTDVLKVLDGLAQAIGVHSTNMVDTLAADQSAPDPRPERLRGTRASTGRARGPVVTDQPER